VARYRLSEPAQADIAALLLTSERHHGKDARIRYRALLTAALRKIASEPDGPLTKDRGDLAARIRSFHIRHGRSESHEKPVGQPVHVVFYRAKLPGLVEVIRVLHERMEPERHLSGPQWDEVL
jgi:toxin ParE1/3/4